MAMPNDWSTLLGELFEARRVLFQCSLEQQARGEAIDPEDTPGRIAFECVMDSLRHDVPCPSWAASAVVERWKKFTNFTVRSLGEAFEIKDQKKIAAMRAKQLCAAIYSEVRELERSIPQKSNRTGKSALEIAGERFHMSTSQIEKKMREWRVLCKETGSDPDAKMELADAHEVLFRAFAENINDKKCQLKQTEKD